MIIKIVSGGQNGVDVAGVDAALSLGISTGGWMPKGWMTLDGPKPEYAVKYFMIEHSQLGYKARTWKNVEDSDGTLQIAAYMYSPGELCTINAIKHYKKPVFVIDMAILKTSLSVKAKIPEFHIWVKKNNIRVLNVAGNSNNTAPGIYTVARKHVTDFILYHNQQEGSNETSV